MNEPENIGPPFGLVLGGIFAGVPFMGVSLVAAALLLLIMIYLLQGLRNSSSSFRSQPSSRP